MGHSWTRTPRILRARRGGLLVHKVCTLLQWVPEARGRGVHNPDPLRAQVCSGSFREGDLLRKKSPHHPSLRMCGSHSISGQWRGYGTHIIKNWLPGIKTFLRPKAEIRVFHRSKKMTKDNIGKNLSCKPPPKLRLRAFC